MFRVHGAAFRGVQGGALKNAGSFTLSTLHSGADELRLYDVREAVAESEAMDLAH